MVNPIRHYRFGPFSLNVEEHLLLRDGEPVLLTPKAFETLVVLVENCARVVLKDELMKEVWPDTFVEESTLAQNIFTLRKTLGRNANGRQYIETYPRRGYRFVETVSEAGAGGGSVPGAEPPGAGAEEGDGGGSQAKTIESLAVLPLVNENADPRVEYLSDGITESIINSLSQLPRLRVMARSIVFRYRGREADPQEVGRELQVRAVMLGRILNLDDRLIVRTELVDVEDGSQLWGAQYNRDLSDIFDVQEKIAEQISEKLRLKLTGEEQQRLARHYTDNTEAYQLYLRGRYHLDKRTAKAYGRAIEYFQQAIDLDPAYALAYSGLADAYTLFEYYGLRRPDETMPKAKAAALRAVELDDTLAEGHTSLGCVRLVYDHDWDGARRAFERALELSPKYAHAHHWYSHYWLSVGRIEESLAASKRALELEPLDLSINLHLGVHYIYARQYEEAIEQIRMTVDMDGNFFFARVYLGMAYAHVGDFARAAEELRQASLIEDNPPALGFLGYVYACWGKTAEAREILDELKERLESGYVPPYDIGIIHAGLGERNEAFSWLEKAYEVRNEWMGWIKVAPEFDGLRPDPRFTELLKRMGLAS
jgi:TolB-like protein/Tfp pilus assembly protein PilF